MATATQPKPTTELAKTKTPFTIAPIAFEVSMEQIAELRREYMPLVITDVNNREQVAAVHEARMVCVKLRRGVEKFAKEMRDEANKYAKSVITGERAITGPIAEIEAHLDNEAGKVQREKDRIASEAEEKQRLKLKGRCDLIVATGAIAWTHEIAAMTDEQFAAFLSEKQADKKARDEQAAAEAAERQRVAEANRIEAERLAAERAELDRQRAEQAAAQAKIDAEHKRIADEKFKARLDAVCKIGVPFAHLTGGRPVELLSDDEFDSVCAKLRAERDAAAEQARLDAIAEQDRLAAEARAHAAAVEAENKRREALRPDHTKLLAIADQVAAITLPGVSVNAAKAATRIEELLAECVTDIREQANQLIGADAS